MPTELQIRNQSQNAIDQWGEQWSEHAKIHSKYPMKSLEDFRLSGTGKACLLIANGFSFEENIDVIKKYQDQVDILCCDKTLGHCLDNGITPTYCIVCDANVSYEEYLKPYSDALSEVILFQNVCGNPEWTEMGNWKDRYFFVNKDVLQSEQRFSQISGCNNFIAAGTNVSNAMLVLLTQCERTPNNFFNYDKYLLIGFDYSWRRDGGYYAFDKDGNGKSMYMRHLHLVDKSGEYCYTSNNLLFSSRWLSKYVHSFNLPVVQCSQHSILDVKNIRDLSEQISYNFKSEDNVNIRVLEKNIKNLKQQLGNARDKMRKISWKHYENFRATV